MPSRRKRNKKKERKRDSFQKVNGFRALVTRVSPVICVFAHYTTDHVLIIGVRPQESNFL